MCEGARACVGVLPRAYVYVPGRVCEYLTCGGKAAVALEERKTSVRVSVRVCARACVGVLLRVYLYV